VTPLAKVIAGGQTGVDQAALRAALACGLERGGWCPPGRACEAGPIPADLPLVETERDRSPAAPDVPRSLRTERNVRDSDATLVLWPSSLAPADPGTGWTLRCAAALGRPVLVCDPFDPGAPERIARWIGSRAVRTLHVAGPRESAWPGIGARAQDVLERAFAAIGDARGGGRE
jgi:hypothetical protein